MAAPFSNFRMNSPRPRGLLPRSPRFPTPRQGVMPMVKRMPGPRPPQQKLGGYAGFCAVCNLHLNSEFQTREHYGGRTHQTNVNMLGPTPGPQPNPNNSGYAGFCAVCNIKLNSEFQTREHYSGKTHQSNMKMLGLTPGAQPNPSNSGFNLSAGPVKRLATDSAGPSNAKKPKLSPSVSGVQGKNNLALLLEYKPGLEFVMKSQPGQNNATLFTATLEIDGKKYDASAPSKKMAQDSVASIVFAYIGSHIEEVLAQKAAEKVERLVSDDGKAEQPKKEPEDFTSLDDICNSESFSCFSSDVKTFAESDTKAATSSGDDPAGNGTSAKSDVSGGDGAVESVSGATTDNGAVPGSGDAMATVASPGAKDLNLSRSSTAILNFVRLRTTRTVSKEPSLNDPLSEEYVVTNVINGEAFKGRAQAKDCAKALAAEEALVKLFGMTFEKDARGIPIFTGETSEIIKARETMQASTPADDASALELVDGKSPVVLLNEIFQGQVTYSFYPRVFSQWGLEHRCSVTVGGMTVEGQDSTKKGAKNRAALAAVAALKASGMFSRLLSETKAQRVGLPIQQVFEENRSSSTKWEPVAEPPLPVVMPSNSTVRLNHLFPGTKYESQGEVVNSHGKKVLMVAVKVGEKVFTGTGSQPKYARANAAENALRALGLWTDEDQESKKQLMAMARAKTAQKNARMGLMDASGATGYHFSQQQTYQPLSNVRARARGQAVRGQGRGRMIRGAGRVTRGLGRGLVARGQRGGTVTRGQRRASATTTRGRGRRGRGSGSLLAIGGNYYDTFSTAGLGLGGPSTLGGTSSQVNFVGTKPRGSPGGNNSINSNLLKMAHGSNYDMADTGCDTTSDVATYEATYNSSSYDPPTDPYATSTPGFYGNPTDPSLYSIPRPSRGRTRASRRPLRSRGLAASHTTPPSVLHHEVTSMSYTQISNEAGSSFGVTTQFIRGTRASAQRRREVRSRGGSAGRGALQSLLPVTYGTDFSQDYNYDTAYAGYEELAQEQDYGSYGDSSTAMELCYPNDGPQYPIDMGYDASSW